MPENSINRFSSRGERLDHAFLAKRLAEAKSYRRIAGYFRSSIFELVGEEIASILDVPEMDLPLGGGCFRRISRGHLRHLLSQPTPLERWQTTESFGKGG